MTIMWVPGLCFLLMAGRVTRADITFPLEDCDTLKSLDNSDIAGVEMTALAAAPGPYGFKVYAYTNPTSSLTIPASAIGFSKFQAIIFAIRVNSYNQNKILFQMGNALVVGQYGQDLRFTSHPVSVFSGVTEVSTVVPVELDVWNTVKVTVAFFINPIFTKTYRLTVNGTRRIDATSRYADLTVSDIEFFSFDGSVSCLTMMEIDDDTAVTGLDNLLCVHYEPQCEAQGPNIELVDTVFCDVSESDSCKTVSFHGQGVNSTSDYRCRIVNHELPDDITSDTISFAATTNVSVPATYVSEEQMDCHLPSESRSAAVTLTSQEHGDLETGKVIIFPMTCFSCESDFSCNLTNIGCYIDGQCYEPYTVLNDDVSEICQPDLDSSGPSAYQEPESVNIKADSCGRLTGADSPFISVEDGYKSEDRFLAAASLQVNMTFFARVDCNSGQSDAPVTIAEIPPAMKIYQIGTKIQIHLNYLNTSTSEEEIDKIEYDLSTKEWQFLQHRQSYTGQEVEQNLTFAKLECFASLSSKNLSSISRWLADLKRQCGLAMALQHNVKTGQTELYINNLKFLAQMGSTAGLQLLMTRPLFLNSSQLSCLEIHNSGQDECGVPSSSEDGCFGFVSMNQRCPT